MCNARARSLRPASVTWTRTCRSSAGSRLRLMKPSISSSRLSKGVRVFDSSKSFAPEIPDGAAATLPQEDR